MNKIIIILIALFSFILAQDESSNLKQAKVSEYICTRTIEYVNDLRDNGDDKLYHFERQTKAYLERGKSRIILKKYDLAFQDLDSVLIREPYNWDVYFQIAKILIYKNQFSESLPYLDIAIENGLSTPEIHLHRGITRFKENYADKGLFDFDFFILNSNIFPNDEEKYTAYYHRGLLKGENGEYLEAINDMTESISINPQNPAPYVQRGNFHRLLGRPRLAIKDLDYALLLNYSGRDLYFYRGLSYIQAKNDDLALDDLNNFLDLSQSANKNRPEALLERGIVYYYLDRLDDALNDLNETISLDPTLWKGYGYRGIILCNKEQYFSGLNDLDVSIRGGEMNPEFYLYRGIASYILSYQDKGLSDLDKYIQNPGFQSTLSERYLGYYYRGVLHLDIGYMNEALIDFSDAIAFDPERPEAFIHRGNAYQLLEKPQSALIDLDMAISLGSNNIDTYLFRGKSYLKLNKYEEAVKDLSSFINNSINANNKNVDAFYNRGIAKYKLSNFESALKDFNSAIELNPAMLMAYGYRGMCHYMLRNFNIAINDLSIGIESGELGNELYLFRGVSKSNLYNFTSALEDINTYLIRSKSEKELFEVYIQRAIIFYNLNLYNDALKDLNMSIELNPSSSAAYMHRANISRIFENYSESLKDLDVAIELGEKDREVFLLRGSINLKLKKYQQAYNDLSYFLINTPDRHKDKNDAILNRAIASFYMTNYKDAKVGLNKVIMNDPEKWLAYRYRGEVLMMDGDNNRALNDFNKATNAGIKVPKIYLLRGEVNIRNNKFEDAYSDLSRFIISTETDNKDLPKAFYNRGIARFFSDDLEGACIDWNFSASQGFLDALVLINKNCDVVSTNTIDITND